MLVFGRQMKVPLGANAAVGGDGVDVGVKMDQFAKGLDAGDHAGHHVLLLEALDDLIEGRLPRLARAIYGATGVGVPTTGPVFLASRGKGGNLAQ